MCDSEVLLQAVHVWGCAIAFELVTLGRNLSRSTAKYRNYYAGMDRNCSRVRSKNSCTYTVQIMKLLLILQSLENGQKATPLPTVDDQ
jgi:hypothetical protein